MTDVAIDIRYHQVGGTSPVALHLHVEAVSAALSASIAAILERVTTMSGTTNNIDQVLADLTAKIDASEASEDKLLVLVQGIPAAIAAAVAAAQSAGATPEQLAAFAALGDRITAETAKADAASAPPASPPATDPNAPPATDPNAPPAADPNAPPVDPNAPPAAG